MAPPCLGIGPPMMMVQAQPVSLCISLAASSIIRGSLSMLLYNTDVNSKGCGVKFLTSVTLNFDLHHHLLPANPPCISTGTPSPSPWLQNQIYHTILLFSYCGSWNNPLLCMFHQGFPPGISAIQSQALTWVPHQTTLKKLPRAVAIRGYFWWQEHLLFQSLNLTLSPCYKFNNGFSGMCKSINWIQRLKTSYTFTGFFFDCLCLFFISIICSNFLSSWRRDWPLGMEFFINFGIEAWCHFSPLSYMKVRQLGIKPILLLFGSPWYLWHGNVTSVYGILSWQLSGPGMWCPNWEKLM